MLPMLNPSGGQGCRTFPLPLQRMTFDFFFVYARTHGRDRDLATTEDSAAVCERSVIPAVQGYFDRAWFLSRNVKGVMSG